MKKQKKKVSVIEHKRIFGALLFFVMTLMLINGLFGGVILNSLKEPSNNIQVEEMSDFVRYNGSSYVRMRKLDFGILERIGFNFVLNNKVLLSEDVRLIVTNDSYNASETYLPIDFVATSSNYEFNISERALYKRNGFSGIWPITVWLFFATMFLINLRKHRHLWSLEKKLIIALIVSLSLGFLISLNTQTLKVENVREVEGITVFESAFEDYVIASEGIDTVLSKNNLNKIDEIVIRAYYYVTPYFNNSRVYGRINGERRLITPASYVFERNNLEIKESEISRRLIYSNTTIARISRFVEIIVYNIVFLILVTPAMYGLWKLRQNNLARIMREEYRSRFLDDEFRNRHNGGVIYDIDYLRDNVCKELEYGAYCEFKHVGNKRKGYFFCSYLGREEIKGNMPETRYLIFLNYDDVKNKVNGSTSYNITRMTTSERLISDVKVIKEKNLYEKGEISDSEPSIFKDSKFLTYQEAAKFNNSFI